MKAICGANCDNCELLKNKKCEGCRATNGCPFGKKCWIAKYNELGGEGSFEEFKKQIVKEFNSLKIDGLSKIDDMYPLHGSYINLEYTLPNGIKTKLLKDDEVYLANQIQSEFNDGEMFKWIGLVANTNFLLVCEFEINEKNPEIIIYKKR